MGWKAEDAAELGEIETGMVVEESNSGRVVESVDHEDEVEVELEAPASSSTAVLGTW